MTHFLVVRILDDRSISTPCTMVYGSVELRSFTADSKLETEALESSASEGGLDFNKHKVCARIATIVECDTSNEAVQQADNKFLEVLDFKSTEFAVSNIKTSKIGFIKDLASGEITPIKKSGFEQSISFVVRPGSIQSFDSTNYVLSIKSDLSERYKRSLHWARNSKNEVNPQLRIIFSWFALEALLKADDNDNSVESYIRLFMGFPNGIQLSLLSATTKVLLENHERYKYWQKKLFEIVIEIRNFRNDSVHSGFRSMDFTKEKLDQFKIVMTFAVARCQAGVMRALLADINSLPEFKEYAVPLFEQNTNLINDTHNNIIYSLEHPMSY